MVGYEYIPSVTKEDILWNFKPFQPNQSGYSWDRRTDYGVKVLRYDSIVSSSDVNISRDLKAIGKSNKNQKIYGLSDKNHPLLIQFFQDYKEDLTGRDAYRIDNAGPISLDDFYSSIPIFFWEDPFGRLMSFYNNDFLPIYMAEPIIYLYPVHDQAVQVQVHAKKGIQQSDPPYDNGWKVLAKPDGKLTHIETGREYPYLFWEGHGPVSPMRKEGHVVSKEKVGELFDTVLPALGLIKKEIVDFKNVWMPRFNNSQYYFITFIDQAEIDHFAPIEVKPKPDTVIRILMDYRPLNKFKKVTAPKPMSPPERNGFTVVEWGGIQRF